MRRILSDEGGQALVEYILMLMVSVTVVIAISTGFRRVVLSLWQIMACEISAACPNCPPPEEVANKIANGCNTSGG